MIIDENEITSDPNVIPFSSFLEDTPPGGWVQVSDLGKPDFYEGVRQYRGHKLAIPEISLYCPSDSCGGLRFFRSIMSETADFILPNRAVNRYLSYRCSNCQNTIKIFSLAIRIIVRESEAGYCYKFGEMPGYGPPTSPKLIKLIGPDRELFLKGHRCENQGLGVGAFTYYRRVVESQKNRILDEVIKVSEKLSSPAEMTTKLRDAKSETQFSKALADIKDAIPQALLLNGQNPFTLLHSALSNGLHDKSDDECLQLAQSVRVVLAELSDRLSQVMKDEAELNRAVANLMNKNGRAHIQ